MTKAAGKASPFSYGSRGARASGWLAVAGTGLSALLGGWDGPVKALLFFMAFDLFSGFAAACKNGAVDSRVMLWGGVGKVMVLALVAADAAAFAQLAAAYRMPKETPQQQEAKQAALQAALVDATEVPLEIMAQCTATLSEIDFMARNGSRMACSDAGAAAVFAKAALQGAALSVLINVDSIANADAVATYRAQMDQLLADGCRQADAVYQYVVSCL